jgi:hypothetical protein
VPDCSNRPGRRPKNSDWRNAKVDFIAQKEAVKSELVNAAQLSTCSTSMAFEKRGNRRTYYYRSIRCGSKVRKIYFGCGPEAEQAAAEDAARQNGVAAARAEQKKVDDALRLTDELLDVTSLLTDAALFAAGFHFHDRTWRFKHETTEKRNDRKGTLFSGSVCNPGSKG